MFRAMKACFENLEAEVDQNEIDLKSGEIEQKNLLITNENLIDECLSKDVFYTATDSVLNVSRFSSMHDAFTITQKHIAELESGNFNLRNKIQNDDHDFNYLKLLQKAQHACPRLRLCRLLKDLKSMVLTLYTIFVEDRMGLLSICYCLKPTSTNPGYGMSPDITETLAPLMI
ncbi:hypothetical protein Tco_0304022 [Tanacetum coccineum]